MPGCPPSLPQSAVTAASVSQLFLLEHPVIRATLLVTKGSNRGSRFELTSAHNAVIGRSVDSNIRLDDSEVSRHHASLSFDGLHFVLRDLGSANGCRVNGHPVRERVLEDGDTLALGTSQLTFQLSDSAHPAMPDAGQIRFVEDAGGLKAGAIQQTLNYDDAAPVPLEATQAGLDLLYKVAEELVTPVQTLESHLQRILELTISAIGADRGCVLLRDPVGADLTVMAFARRDGGSGLHLQMPVSRSITDYVLRHGTAVLTSDASVDERFTGGQSIVSEGICEAICAPMRGRADLLGVFYLDTTTTLEQAVSGVPTGRLTEENLRVVVTAARQTALAIESRQFQDALVKAERFAAMGQTIAVLSHHIKNILQGVRGGSHLIRMGMVQSREELIRQGWGIVERNQTRIYDLVMDMLSFSRDRVPVLRLTDLNKLVAEVAELAAARAAESGVTFEYRPAEELPPASFDAEGIHRAILNIVGNAIEAVESVERGAVVLQTGYDRIADMMIVAVSDNGPGIPEDQRQSIFNVFESSKGSRGTGIGLPVSRKILREHGGRVRVEGGPGQGTRFVLSWPRGMATVQDIAALQPRNND